MSEKMQMQSKLPRYLTIDQIVEITHANKHSVKRWMYDGRLKSYKVGRHRLTTEADLLAMIEAGGAQ